MSALEELLSKRFIIKADNKERYYRIKDGLGDVRKFATEKMGFQIIVNSLLIKLEKIPVKPENSMGIAEFDNTIEYAFLCVILMFLEDKEPEEQFVLSQLTEYIASNMQQPRIDWTLYNNRRRLIKVIRYCVKNGILKVDDGSDDVFANDDQGEVLYENTGISKYMMRNFTKDIMGYLNPRDFETSDWVEVDEDRGVARRHRVYKRLLMSTGIYRKGEDDEDFEYLKRYKGRMEEDFSKLNCQLQVHKSSAYLIMSNDCKIGKSFPDNNSLSDIVLLCNQTIRNKVKSGDLRCQVDETIQVTDIEFERIVLVCKEQYGSGFVKTYREKTSTEFAMVVTEEMERLGFIERNKERKQIIIKPIVGKVLGEYPKEYKTEAMKNE